MLTFLIVISYWVASQLMLQMQGMFLNILLNLCNPRKYFEIASLKIIDIFYYFVVCTAKLKEDTLYAFFFFIGRLKFAVMHWESACFDHK